MKDAKDLDDIPLKAENDKVRKSPQFGEPVVKPLERSAEEFRLSVNVVEFRIDFRIEVPAQAGCLLFVPKERLPDIVRDEGMELKVATGRFRRPVSRVPRG